jgi:hypothetical protein
VSKVLPISRAFYYFCAYSDLSLLYEVYRFSSHTNVLGIPLESFGLRFSRPRYKLSENTR